MSQPLGPHQISEIAAFCRKHNIWGKLPILRHARLILSAASVPATTPDRVRSEIDRQKAIAVLRGGQHLRQCVPIATRWPEIKRERALEVIEPIITSGTYYHTTKASARFDAQHLISLEWGKAAATGKTQHGGSQKYGRSGWHRTHVNWHSTITLPIDWYTKVRPRGLCYRKHLILDAQPTVRAGVYTLVLLVQGRGAKLMTREIFARHTETGWRASSARISALDLVLGDWLP